MFVQSLPRLAQRSIAIVMALLARSLQPILSIAGDKHTCRSFRSMIYC